MDALSAYIKSISDYPRISRDREKELGDIIQNSDDADCVTAAKNELANSNLKLVVSRASKYYKIYGGRVDIMELVGGGNNGLIKAVNSYNPLHKSNAKFSTFATQIIDRDIHITIDKQNIVHFPAIYKKYLYLLKEIEFEYNEALSEKDVAEKLDVSLPFLERLRSIKTVAYLEDSSINGEVVNWEEKVSSDFNPDMEDLGKDLDGFMGKLSKRDRGILKDLYFDNALLKDVACKNELTSAKVRDISHRCLRLLRNTMTEEWDRSTEVNPSNKSQLEISDEKSHAIVKFFLAKLDRVQEKS